MGSNAYLRTLGCTELEISDRVIQLTSREAALVAYLCTRRGFRTTRTEIARLFWPHSTVARARHSFSQLIYAFRGKVGDCILVTHGDTIAVANTCADFVELVRDVTEGRHPQAHERYGGRFLSGEELYSRDLQDWCDRIERDTVNAVADAIKEHASACGNSELTQIIQTARDLLNVYPHLESAQIALLEALARCGHDRDVESLHKEFISDGGRGSVPPLESFIGRRTTPIYSATVRFAGRTTETATLQRYWDLVEAGQGQVVVIYGEPGIGKTRLADHFLRKVAINGGGTWIARCCAATQRLPYTVVTELIRDNPAGFRSEEGQAALRHLETIAESATGTTDEYRYRLTECVTGMLLRHCMNRPVAILVDDAQWADDYTAVLVSYWSYKLKDQKVMIILTARTQDADPLPAWIGSNLGQAHAIELGRVSVEAAFEIAAGYETSIGVTIDKGLREAAIWRSAGQPFLLLEALRSAALADDGASASTILSESGESLLRRRFRHLSPTAEAVLGMLAVWGRAIHQATLATFAGLSDDDLANALNTLHSRGIAQLNEGRIAFVHDLMREAAYKYLAPATSALLHRRAGAYLVEDGGPTGLIAHHYARGGDQLMAASYAEKAARDAAAAHSYADFEYYCRMAIEYGDTSQKESAADILSKHLIQMGRTAEIDRIRHLLTRHSSDHGVLHAISELERELATGTQEAGELLRLAQDVISHTRHLADASVAPVVATLLDVALDTGSLERGAEMIAVLCEGVRAAGEGETQLAIESIAAVWHGITEGTDGVISTAENIVKCADEHTSPPTRALCLTAHGTLLLLAGRIRRAKECFRSALVLATQAGDARRQTAIHNNNGVVLLESGDAPAARQCFDRVLTASNVHCRIRGLGNLAILHYENGDLANARRIAEAVLAMNSTYKSQMFERLGNALCGLSALSMGDHEAVRGHIDRVEAVSWSGHVAMDVGYATTLACRVQASRGEISEAIRRIDETIEAIGTRDVLCAQRLLCEKAYILGPVDPEASAIINRKVQKSALESGANLIADRARKAMCLHDHRG